MTFDTRAAVDWNVWRKEALRLLEAGGASSTPSPDVEGVELFTDDSGAIFYASLTDDGAGAEARDWKLFPAGTVHVPTSAPTQIGGFEYAEGATEATPTGNVFLGQRADNSLQVPRLNANDQLEVSDGEIVRVSYSLSDGAGGTTATGLTGFLRDDLLYTSTQAAVVQAVTALVPAWDLTGAAANGDAIDIEIAATEAETSPVPVLYDIVGDDTNQRGFQVGSEVQPENYPASPRLTIGTATGNATNLRPPQAVLLQEKTIRLSAAISEVAAFTVPAQNATVVVTATNGVIGGNILDLNDIETPGNFVFAAADDGTEVAGLYEVVSGAIATGLTIRRVDDGTLALVENSGQAIATVGAATAGPMHLAVYTRVEPLASQSFWTVEGLAGREVISGAFENLSSTDSVLRSASVQDFIQLSARDIAFSSQLGALHGRFPISEFLGDGDSADVLNAGPLYLHGLGDSTGEKDALALVNWWAGYYPGSTAHA